MDKKTQTLASFTFGVTFVVTMVLISIVAPNPSNFQYTIFRIVMALAAGGVVAAFPGFIEVKFGKWLRAGGALAVFSIVYYVSPAPLDKPNSQGISSEEKLELGIDTSFMHEYTYAYTVIRPVNSPPRIHQLATWQRLFINNQSKEPINITELRLVVNDNETASDKLEGPFFENIHPDFGSIKFSKIIQYPIRLEPKEFKFLFVSLPTEISPKIGEISLNILHDPLSKKDSIIELFLFGNEPEIVFSKFMPAIVNGKEELLIDGEKISTMISYSDVSLQRQIGFLTEEDFYIQKGIGSYDDGFRMIRASELFNMLSNTLTKNNDSIAEQKSPIDSAVLSARTSMNETFSIQLKPASTLIKYTKA
ncbi:hypothetical protein ACK325_07775 [Aeromonas hydrophila]|uniref:hypothetical protein n=1 Tax=Aeromonas hydrophila TaxID=644 RepID=UPI00398988AF